MIQMLVEKLYEEDQCDVSINPPATTNRTLHIRGRFHIFVWFVRVKAFVRFNTVLIVSFTNLFDEF